MLTLSNKENWKIKTHYWDNNITTKSIFNLYICYFTHSTMLNAYFKIPVPARVLSLRRRHKRRLQKISRVVEIHYSNREAVMSSLTHIVLSLPFTFQKTLICC